YLLVLSLILFSVFLSYHERERVFTLLFALEDLRQVSSQQRARLLKRPVLIEVDSKEGLELALSWQIPRERIVVGILSEVPLWYSKDLSLIYKWKVDGKLRLPRGNLPISNAMNLVLEMVPAEWVSPTDLLGLKTIWVHRIFPEEEIGLKVDRRWKRLRRALRERSVRVIDFPHKSSSSYEKEVKEFLEFLGSDWKLGLEFQDSEFAKIPGGKWLQGILILFLGWIYGFYLYLLIPALLLPGSLGTQAVGLGFTILGPLILYFRLRKLTSPGRIILLPGSLFLHTIIMGSVYSLLMHCQAFQARIFLPVGIKFSLLLPAILITSYELYSLIAVACIQRTRRIRGILISLALLILAILILATMIYRSSNHAVLPVFDLELSLRLWFEDCLVSRPRLREILGYWGLGFLFMDAYFRFPSLRFLGRLCLILALVSAFNTYSHFHTDYWFRVLREFHAFWIGSIPLVALFFFLSRQVDRRGTIHLGYFGFSNLGDDLLAVVMFRRSSGSGHRFLVKHHGKLNLPGEVKRSNFAEILDAGVSSRFFSLGPGGILQDRSSLVSLLYYLGFCMSMKLLGTRILWQHQGVSPFRYHFSRVLVGWCAKFVEEISVRDQDSVEVLVKCSVERDRISIKKDLVFDLNPENPQIRSGSLGIVLRSWNDFSVELWIEILKEVPLSRTYFLFQEDPQLEALIRSLDPGSQIQVYHSDSLGFALDFIKSERILSMRYHGLVLGLISSRPVFGICYDQKCVSLLRGAGV
ncbi:hypothetical protein HOF92_12065, partial [bacterium]|nr:hypothetical protein [bacterium]